MHLKAYKLAIARKKDEGRPVRKKLQGTEEKRGDIFDVLSHDQASITGSARQGHNEEAIWTARARACGHQRREGRHGQ